MNINPLMANLLGKVVGKFDCNCISCYKCDSDQHKELSQSGSCLSMDEIIEYCNGNEIYGWNIDNLMVYEKPKRLFDFNAKCKKCTFEVESKEFWNYCYGCDKLTETDSSLVEFSCDNHLEKPPQNWVYIES